MFDEPFYQVSPLQPPGYIFSLAWLIIYPLIGVSGVLLFKHQPDLAILWLIQLLINLTWVPGLFFVRNLTFSFIHLFILLVLIIIIFYYASITVKALWLPYILWVSYATIIFFDTLLQNSRKC